MPWKQVRDNLSFFIITSFALVLGAIYFCIAPLYLSTVEKAAFANSLDELGNNLHPQIVTSFAPLSESPYIKDRGAINSAAKNSFTDSFIANEVYAVTPRSGATIVDRPGVDSVAFFQYQSGYDAHVNIIEGQLPVHHPGGAMQVAIGALAASKLNINAGDTIEIASFRSSDDSIITARVTSIITPVDINEMYWAGQGPEYFDTELQGDRWLLRLFVNQESFFALADEYSLLGTTKDIIYLDRLRLIELGVDKTDVIVSEFAANLRESFPSGDLFLGIEGNLERFKRQLTRSSIPLTIVFSLSSIVSLYIFLMLGLVLKEVYLNQIILLRSRGANLSDIMTNVFSSIMVVVVSGLIFAPIISYGIMKILSITPVWSNTPGLRDIADLNLLLIYPWILGGLSISLLFIVFPTLNVMRSQEVIVDSTDQYRHKPFWVQRFFLDAWFFILAGILLLQFFGIKSEGREFSFENGKTLSELENITLIMPIIVVVFVALVFSRLFPLLASLASYSLSKTNFLSVKLAIDRIARFPADSLLLGGLVLLVSTVGAFLASFGGTLEKSQEEAAYFNTGGDAKISRPGGFESMSFSDLEEVLGSETGISNASATYRSSGGIGSIQAGTLVPLLGVDVSTIGDTLVTNSVDNFDLETSINKLTFASPSSVGPRTIDSDATSISLWVKPEYGKGNRFLWLHILDSTGASHIYSMGSLNFYDWTRLTVELARRSQPAPPGPYKLKSILIYENAFGASGSPGSLLLDNLTIENAQLETLEIDNFDNGRDWLPVLVTGTRADSVGGTVDSDRGQVLRFEWGRETLQRIRGIYVTPKFDRVPALANKRFLSLKGMDIGGVTSIYISGRIVPIRIVGSINKFPTLDPNPVGFLVLDGENLLDHLNVTNVGPYVWPNEVIIKFPENGDNINLETFLSDKPKLNGTVTEKSTMMATSDKNPLEAPGWKGAALLSSAYTLLLLALGIGSYLLYIIRKTTRDVAILTALGLGSVSNNLSLSLGYFATVIASLPIGLLTGFLLSQILVPRFNNLSVQDASPYYSLSIDLLVLTSFCAVIVTSLVLFTLAVRVTQKRLSVATIIRSDSEV